jgi:hypothetical protein
VFEAMMARIHQLSVSVEALAALGAQLRLRQDRLEGDPHLRGHPRVLASGRISAARPAADSNRLRSGAPLCSSTLRLKRYSLHRVAGRDLPRRRARHQ